ncbi:MAG: hypothetical protein ABIK09_03335 [Pseudomonadota bacterium]
MKTFNKRTLSIIVVLAVIVAGAALSWWLFSGSSGAAAKQHRKAFKILPEGTAAIFTVDAGVLAEQAFKELEKAVGVRIDDEESRKEVGTLFEERLGLDPLKISTVTVFVVGNDTGLLVRGDFEFDPSVGQEREYEGHTLFQIDAGMGGDIWAAAVGGALALGERDILGKLIDVERGELKALDGTKSGDLHEDLLDKVGGGVLVGTVVLNEDMKKELSRELGDASVDGVGLRMDAKGGGSVVLVADAATRKMLLRKLEDLKDQARDGVAEARDHVDDMEVLQGAGVILADNHMDHLFEMFTPEDTGDSLRLDIGGGGGGIMAASAVMSVVAVPAFIKYMRKAKTAEAVDMLDKLYKGSVDYFTTPRVEPDSAGQTFAPCRFPEDAPLTPGLYGACDSPDERWPANPSAWDHPSWSALRFEISDSHYFAYSFDSSGKDDSAQFTVHAQADLDCDGNFSTFQRYGKGEAVDMGYGGSIGGECRVSQGAALYTYNETE